MIAIQYKRIYDHHSYFADGTKALYNLQKGKGTCKAPFWNTQHVGYSLDLRCVSLGKGSKVLVYIIGTFNFNFVLPIWWLSNGLDVHFSHQLKHHFICVAGSNVSFCVNCLKGIFKVTLRVSQNI